MFRDSLAATSATQHDLRHAESSASSLDNPPSFLSLRNWIPNSFRKIFAQTADNENVQA